jgi:hypothetical protein
MTKKIMSLFVTTLLATLLASKVARHLFQVDIVWVYVVAPVVFAVGAVVVARRHRHTS